MAQHTHSVQSLHEQTARIDWPGLERHFARGVVIEVADHLDLVEVAACLANDDKAAVSAWLDAGDIRHLPRETAQRWAQADAAQLWAVVVAPWVVVQERRS